jgi:hypothetical protein
VKLVLDLEDGEQLVCELVNGGLSIRQECVSWSVRLSHPVIPHREFIHIPLHKVSEACELFARIEKWMLLK